jgi:hypothetical protein
MTKKILTFVSLIMMFAFAAAAADVDGKWVAQVPGRDGQTREVTYTFKAEGNELTGTMTGFQGNEIPISDGKIDGDNVSFVVTMEFNGNSIKWNYTGKVSGDEMTLKREGGRGPAREFTAKRTK